MTNIEKHEKIKEERIDRVNSSAAHRRALRK